MDPEVMMKSLNVLVKQGKAQVFGKEGEEGVKFF
jgi:ESCRT-II complex subunit VPS25